MRTRQFYAVIHAAGHASGFLDAATALRAGADGVALIDQYCSEEDVEEIARTVRRHFPDARICVNLLGNLRGALCMAARVEDALVDAAGASPLLGIWSDTFDAFLDGEAENLRQMGRSVFVGVGFKGQREAPWFIQLLRAKSLHEAAAPVIPMTSGSRTGVPPEVEKLQTYRQILGDDCPLAVASGVSAQNIREMLPLATHFFVGTSLERVVDGRTLIWPDSVSELATIVQDFNSRYGLK